MGDDLLSTSTGNGIQKHGAVGAPPAHNTGPTSRVTGPTGPSGDSGDEQIEADSPINESREQKFVRLALARMPNVKKHMRLVANLASYPHSEAQRDRIMSELRKMVAEVDAAFAPRQNRDDNFRF